MTLHEAFKFARTDPGNQVNDQWIRDWNTANAVIVAAGYCPDCAAGSHQKQKLGPWQPGNIAEYAGRRCPVCEQFWKCGEQPEYATHSEDAGHSDADPGL